jgi:putative transposase
MPHWPHPGYCALRRGRASLDGQIYLVTFTTFDRRRWFLDHDAARVACRSLTDARLWERSALLAWVLMPDHWHGIVALGGGESLERLLNRLKSNVARRVRLEGVGIGRVWADGFHDHALREQDDLVALARYVVLNPVRAGLVRRVFDYSYWDAVWLDGKASGLTALPRAASFPGGS